jgi:hypothetical protein
MATCPRCNTENLEGSQFCDECGAPLAVSPSPEKDPSTGASGDPTGESEIGTDSHRLNGRKEWRSGRETIVAHEIASMPEDSVVAHAKLVIERGRSAGKQFTLSDDESQIGRWDADGGIFPDVDLDSDDPEAKVSRRHARIVLRNGQYFIEDLGSTNGTFINRGRRLLPGDRQPLRDGDEIIVGKTFLRFHVVK